MYSSKVNNETTIHLSKTVIFHHTLSFYNSYQITLLIKIIFKFQNTYIQHLYYFFNSTIKHSNCN